jgi:hypothetical protein
MEEEGEEMKHLHYIYSKEILFSPTMLIVKYVLEDQLFHQPIPAEGNCLWSPKWKESGSLMTLILVDIAVPA